MVFRCFENPSSNCQLLANKNFMFIIIDFFSNKINADG